MTGHTAQHTLPSDSDKDDAQNLIEQHPTYIHTPATFINAAAKTLALDTLAVITNPAFNLINLALLELDQLLSPGLATTLSLGALLSALGAIFHTAYSAERKPAWRVGLAWVTAYGVYAGVVKGIVWWLDKIVDGVGGS